MAMQARFCGRCGAQLAPNATFCGRCGAPQVAQSVTAAPVYNYPMAAHVAYPTRRQYRTSQVAIAGGLLAILSIVTVAVSAFAVSRFVGGGHSTCTSNCAPKIITPLAATRTYHSSAYNFEVDYFPSWTVRSQDASGVSLGTRLGLVEVAGMKSGQPLDQVLESTVSALPTAQWQNVAHVADLKGAHLGDQDGIGAVYSADLVGSNATAAQVRFAVIAATRGGVTVVFFAADPADPKHSPHGIPEGQQFDYMCTAFRWGG